MVKNVDMISIVLHFRRLTSKDRDTMFGFGGSINLFDVKTHSRQTEWDWL